MVGILLERLRRPVRRLLARIARGGTAVRSVVGVVLVVGAGGWLLNLYSSLLVDNRSWVSSASVNQTSIVTVELFDEAVQSGLIAVDRDKDRLNLVVASCENQLAPVVGDPVGDAARDHAALLAQLCTSPEGALIREEITQWNNSFLLLALRDDHSRDGSCQDGQPVIAAFLPIGCKQTIWQVERLDGSGGTTPGSAIEGVTPPHAEFAMVAADARPWSSDWSGVVLDPGRTERYRMRALLPVKSETLTVDLIGRPTRILLNGRSATLNAETVSERHKLDRLAISRSKLCDRRDARLPGGCRRVEELALAHAHRITIDTAGQEELDLTIEASPIRSIPRPIVHLSGAGSSSNDADQGTGTRFTLRRTPHLTVTCSSRLPEPGRSGCMLAWNTVDQTERSTPETVRILDGDRGIDLIDPATAQLTEAAFDIGLGPLIGFGPYDFGSLISRLVAIGGPGPVTVQLTIDAAAQKIVQNVLSAKLDPCTGANRAGSCTSRENTRAAIVLVKAGRRPGEILAIGMWPPVPRGLNQWDVSALKLGGGSVSALSGFAWRATDGDTTPGSTFKTVTAIAAADRALGGDSGMAALVRGEMTAKEVYRMLGLTTMSPASCSATDSGKRTRGRRDVLVLPVRGRQVCVSNFSGSPFSGMVRSAKRTGCPDSGHRRGTGLCEALMVSSNLWFAGTALVIDGDKPAPDGLRKDSGRSASLDRTLELVDRAARLFPGETRARLDLVSGTTVGRDDPPGSQGVDDASPLRGPPQLLAAPVAIRAGAPGGLQELHRLRIALAGYGQAVEASPLAMASILSSIGAGRIIRPHLVRRVADFPHDPEEGAPLFRNGDRAGQAAMRSEIRAGLAAVVHRPGGTAHKAFVGNKLDTAPGRERLFAKTGTATVGFRGHERFTAWLAGWIDGRAGRGINDRIGFACMVTDLGDSALGGKVCGPIVRDVLEALDQGG